MRFVYILSFVLTHTVVVLEETLVLRDYTDHIYDAFMVWSSPCTRENEIRDILLGSLIVKATVSGPRDVILETHLCARNIRGLFVPFSCSCIAMIFICVQYLTFIKQKWAWATIVKRWALCFWWPKEDTRRNSVEWLSEEIIFYYMF